MKSNIVPAYSLKDIQLSVESCEFDKGMRLYQEGKVGQIEVDCFIFKAEVAGTKKYNVSVMSSHFDRGECDCYLGEKNYLCKHIIALAIAVVYTYAPSAAEVFDHPLDQAVCSGKVYAITEEEKVLIEKEIKEGLALIKSWSGPSKKWFEYQDALTKSSRIILLSLSKLPICEKSVDICIYLLKKLDKKLLHAVDDSDGTIGTLMEEIVQVLCLFVDFKKDLGPYIAQSLPQGEMFEWDNSFFLFHEELRVYRKNV